MKNNRYLKLICLVILLFTIGCTTNTNEKTKSANDAPQIKKINAKVLSKDNDKFQIEISFTNDTKYPFIVAGVFLSHQ